MMNKIIFILQAQRRNSKEKSNGNTRNKNWYIRHEDHLMSLYGVVTAGEKDSLHRAGREMSGNFQNWNTERKRGGLEGRQLRVGWEEPKAETGTDTTLDRDNSKSFQNWWQMPSYRHKRLRDQHLGRTRSWLYALNLSGRLRPWQRDLEARRRMEQLLHRGARITPNFSSEIT